MGPADIFLIALGLGMDAAAVSLAASAAGYAGNPRAVFRLSFHFGLFQFLFPVLGWFLGQGLLVFIQAVSHWVAFLLLIVVGGRMVKSGWIPMRNPMPETPPGG